MAVSKNNRKKSKKRSKGHAAPQTQEIQQTNAQRMRDWNREQIYKFAALGIMVVGFLIAMFTPYGIVGYPITFVGSLLCLFKTKWDTTNHKISFVCYIVYCILVAMLWIQLIR